MFTRLRWFTLGVVATMGTTVYLYTRVRRLRERMTPRAVARASLYAAADAMEAAGRRLATARGAGSAGG